MYPRPRRLSRRRRNDLLVRAAQLAGFDTVARGERAPINPREEAWDRLRREGYRVPPDALVVPRLALLVEQALAGQDPSAGA